MRSGIVLHVIQVWLGRCASDRCFCLSVYFLHISTNVTRIEWINFHSILVQKQENKWMKLTSVQNSHPHCVNFVNLSGWTLSARHNLHVAIDADDDRDDEPLDDASDDVAIASTVSSPVRPIDMKFPWLRFREYREPLAASDSRLEHREHVAIEGLRRRFNGLIGSKLPEERVSASTVSHFFMPLRCTNGFALTACKLVLLPSRRNMGITLHRRCCTWFSDVVEANDDRSLRMSVCSDGLRVSRTSDDPSSRGTVWWCNMDVGAVVIGAFDDGGDADVAVVVEAFIGAATASFDTFRPTRVFSNCSKRLYFGGVGPPIVCGWGPSDCRPTFVGRTRLALRTRTWCNCGCGWLFSKRDVDSRDPARLQFDDGSCRKMQTKNKISTYEFHSVCDSIQMKAAVDIELVCTIYARVCVRLVIAEP